MVIDTSTDQAHALTGPAAAVWLAAESGTYPALPHDVVDAAVDELINLGLLLEPEGTTRRVLLQRTSVVAAGVGILSIGLPEAAYAGSGAQNQTLTGNSTFTITGPFKNLTLVIAGGGGGAGAAGTGIGGSGGGGGTITWGPVTYTGTGTLILTHKVGKQGSAGSGTTAGAGGTAGGNTGGAGGAGGAGHGAGSNNGAGGGGGGSSEVVLTGTSNASGTLVAGGGGGGGGGGGTGGLSAPTGLSATATSGSGLANSTNYVYSVTAVDSAGGETTASGTANATTSSGTGANHQITLSWTAVTGAASYNIYRTRNPTSTTTRTLYASSTTAGYVDKGTGTGSATQAPFTNSSNGIGGTGGNGSSTGSGAGTAGTAGVSSGTDGNGGTAGAQGTAVRLEPGAAGTAGGSVTTGNNSGGGGGGGGGAGNSSSGTSSGGGGVGGSSGTSPGDGGGGGGGSSFILTSGSNYLGATPTYTAANLPATDGSITLTWTGSAGSGS